MAGYAEDPLERERSVVEPIMRRNRWLIILVSGLLGMAESIWTGSVLAAFIFLMSNESNSVVGFIEAASGVATLLFALPIGYIADKTSKAKVVKAGSAVTLLAVLCTSWVVWEATERSHHTHTNSTNGTGTMMLAAGWGVDTFGPAAEHDDGAASSTTPVPHQNEPSWLVWVLGGCMVLWGIQNGVQGGPAEALFADSCDEGTRSKWYNYLFVVYLFGATTGPIVAYSIFERYGNTWSLPELRRVFLAGMALEAVAIPLSLSLQDVKDPAAAGKNKPMQVLSQAGAGAGEAKDKGTDTKRHAAPGKYTCCCASQASIPWIMFSADVLIALGSGMTTKFFPLFFQNDLLLTPSGVQVVYIIVPIAMALLSTIATYVAKCAGRVQTIMAFNFLGIACLGAMVYLDGKIAPTSLCVIYIIRTGLMNSTYPINESILMDVVDKEQRARWKSLGSVSRFGWCGSAVIGGLLADKYTYSKTFLITAFIQLASTLLFIPLLFLVPKESEAKGTGGDGGGHENEPLLQQRNIYEDDEDVQAPIN